MRPFIIYFGSTEFVQVTGIEFAWEVYRKARDLAELLYMSVSLVDGITGEIIEYWSEEEED